MFRTASRALLRTAQISLVPGRTVSGRRFLTTEPPHLHSRSWKNSAARWGLAVAGIYFYNTNPAFADEPAFSPIEDTDDALEEPSPLGLDSVPRREKVKQRQALESATGATPADQVPNSQLSRETSNDPSFSSPADLEEEASSEGAFNPETGEINWDCPCLGGMAYGPCGEDFKGAFSCFVFSKEEPKGMDCIDNFKKMQDCFREHPDVYAGELADDDEFEEGSEMAEERAELAKEVQERRRAVQEKQAQGEVDMPQKRLLEESPAPPRPARKTASKTAPDSQKTKQRHKTQEGVQLPASSDPHPGTIEEHKVADLERRETMSEDAPSRLTQKPASAPVQGRAEEQIEMFDESSELVPKAWHDAQDARVPSKGEEKK